MGSGPSVCLFKHLRFGEVTQPPMPISVLLQAVSQVGVIGQVAGWVEEQCQQVVVSLLSHSRTLRPQLWKGLPA